LRGKGRTHRQGNEMWTKTQEAMKKERRGGGGKSLSVCRQIYGPQLGSTKILQICSTGRAKDRVRIALVTGNSSIRTQESPCRARLPQDEARQRFGTEITATVLEKILVTSPGRIRHFARQGSRPGRSSAPGPPTVCRCPPPTPADAVRVLSIMRRDGRRTLPSSLRQVWSCCRPSTASAHRRASAG